MANDLFNQLISNSRNNISDENPYTNQVFSNLNSLNKTEDKIQKLAIPSIIKELEINGSSGASFIGGTSHYNNKDVINFLNTDDASLERAYGKEALNSKYKILSDINRENDVYNQTTSPIEKLGTFSTGVAQGAINSVGGMLGYGAGLLDADTGSEIAKQTNNLSNSIGDLRSPKEQAIINISNKIMALQSEDADREYQEDLANGDNFALLKRLGKGIAIAAKQAASNNSSASDLLGQGVGSLIPTIAVAMATSGSSTVPTIGSRLAVAGTAAAMGAGEGYINAQQEIQNMDNDALLNGSDEYKSLLDSGYSQEDAKNIIANKAGLLAGTLSAPVNAAGGGITHEFLAAPFSVAKKATGKGFIEGSKAALGTTLKEGTEEFTQGGATQIASNIGVKEFANKDKDIFQDVGEQATLEGIGGLGTAGLGQSIGIARNLTKKGVTKIVDATTPQEVKDKNKFIKTTANINNSLIELNNTPEVKQDTNINETNNTSINTNDNINKNISEQDNKIIDILKENNVISQDVNPKTSIEVISLYNSLLDNPAFDDADRIMLADRIKDQLNSIEQFSKLTDDDILSYGENANIYDNLRKYSKEFQENPLYNNVKENLNKLIDNSVEELSTKDIDLSNHKRDTINTIINTIDSNPEIINEKLINNLNTANVDTTKYQEKINENKKLTTIKEDLGKDLKLTNKDIDNILNTFDDNFSNYVSNEISIKGNSNNKGKSYLQFKKEINSPTISHSLKVRNNNQLNKFASHLANKLNAMDLSQDTTKQNISYDFLTPSGKFYSQLKAEGKNIQPNNIYFNLKANKTKLAYGSILIDYLLAKKTIDEINQKNPDLKYTGINIEPNLKYFNEIPNLSEKLKSTGLDKYLPKNVNKESIHENNSNNNVHMSNNNDSDDRKLFLKENKNNNSNLTKKITITTDNLKNNNKDNNIKIEEKNIIPEISIDTISNNTYGSDKIKSYFKLKENATKSIVYDNNDLSINYLKNKILNNFPKISENNLNSLSNLFKYIPEIFSNLDKYSDKILNLSKDNIPNSERFLNNPELMDNTTYTPALFIDKNTGKYITPIKRAVALGLFDTLLNTPFITYNDDLINYNLEKLSENDLNILANSLSETKLIRNLAKNIDKELQLDSLKDTPIKVKQDLTKVLATQIISSMNKSFFDIYHIKNDKGHITNHYTISNNFKEKYLNNNFSKGNNLSGIYPLISAKLSNTEPKLNFSFEPIKNNYINYTASKLPLNDKQKKVIDIQNNTAFKINDKLLNLYNKIGNKNLHYILGFETLPQKKGINVKYAESVVGKNQSITTGFNKFKQILSAIPEGTTNPSVYFTSKVISSGRFMFDGISPQNNKFLRHLLLPTEAKYNLSDDYQHNTFLRAVAQGLGAKIQKIAIGDEQKAIDDILTKTPEIKDSLDIMLDDNASKDDLFNALNKIKNVTKEIPYMLHTLIEYTEYLKAIKNNNKEFNSNLFIELDGMANGAALNLINFSPENLNDPMVKKLYNAIGIYFEGQEFKNTQEYFSQGGKDIYELMADMANTYIKLNNEKVNPSLERLLVNSGIMEFNDRLPVFSRSLFKNPTMTYNYLSGQNTMANALLFNELAPQIYKAIAEVQMGKYKSILEHPLFNGLTEKDLITFFNTDSNGLLNPSFEILPSISENDDNSNDRLAHFIKNILIKPAYTALDKNLSKSRNIIELAANISKMQQIAIYDKVNNILKINNKSLQNLSEKEIKEIISDTIKQYGLINGINGNIDIADIVYDALTDNSVKFKDLLYNKNYTTYYDIPMLSAKKLNSVGMGAMYNINNADVAIMMNTFSDPEFTKISGLIQVYDGININPLDMDNISKLLNKSVFNVMQENTVLPLIEAADSIIHNFNVKNTDIIENRKTLDYLNKLIQRRKDSILGVGFTIHQMVGSPEGYKYTPEKSYKTLENSTNFAIENSNKNYGESSIVNLLQIISINKQNKTILGKIDYNKLINHLINDKLINKDILRVIKKIEKSNKIYSDLTIYVGTSKELNDFANSKRILANMDEVSIKDGAYDPSDNSIYLPINNISYESVAHELIHAALSHKIYDYYHNPDKQNYTDKLAIENLEKIFEEFVSISLNNKDNLDKLTLDKLEFINQIPDNANKLNEFIAYTLSNPAIKAIAKATKVTNPLIKITKKVINLIKKLLGLDTFIPANNVFEHVMFNTDILLNSKTINYSSNGDLLNINNDNNLQINFGRLFSNINDFSKQISSYVDAAILDKDLSNSGFNMSPEQSFLFKVIYAAIDASLELNSRNRIESEELMDHVLTNINENTFNNNKQYDFILNKNNSNNKPINMFAKLIALAQTNDEFKQILSKLPLPKNKIKVESFDSLVDYLSNKLLSSMDNILAGKSYSKDNGQNIKNALDILAKNLGKNEEQSSFDMVSDNLSKVNSLVNDKASGIVESLANAVFDHYENNSSKIGTTARLVSSVFSKKYGEIGADSITNFFNKNNTIPKVISELFTEMRGITQYNKNIIRIIKKSKGLIARIRQQYKEKYPQEIKDIFGKNITEKQYSSLFKTVGNTDLSVFSNNEIYNILTNLSKELDNYKNKLSNNILKDADNLANFLSGNKFNASTLHRNAYSIALENNVKNLENTIDKYITLKALSLNKLEDLDILKDIYSSNPKAIETVLNLLRDMHNNEYNNTNNKFVGYKGFLPKSKKNTKQVIVVPTSKINELIQKGYTSLGKVNGMPYQYMYSPVGLNESIQQGALQFVQSTYAGANQFNGISRGDMTSNYIPARKVASLSTLDKNKANLIPVRDNKGLIKGYEFYIPTEYALPDEGNRNINIADAIGEYFGRKYEELFGNESNKAAIDELYDLYSNDIDKDQYINVSTISDKTIKDIWNNIPRELKIKIENKFGKDKFFIRKDMINNAIGYRNFSIGDIFNDENNNINPEFKRIIVDFVKTIFGNNAYNYMVQAERILKSAVATAKDIIVIRSVVVPVANMISNVIQLQLEGVPTVQIIKGLNSKFKEIRHYTENNDKILKLQFLRKNEKNLTKLKNIDARIELLKKSNRALTIWPLINAGELSTITDELKLENDSIMQGKWIENIQNKIVDNTPKSLQNAMKQALMTKDTSIYKIMFAGTQYGDFLAKAIYYDYLIQNKKLSEDNAMMQITDEFINYDSNAGRMRSYLDMIGATWFMNYKIRSMKIAHKMLRNRPFAALIATLGYIPSIPYINIGNPMSDNLWAKAYNGGLWYSIGPRQGLNAPNLLPVAGLF